MDFNILSTTQGHLRMTKLCHKQTSNSSHKLNFLSIQTYKINPYSVVLKEHCMA